MILPRFATAVSLLALLPGLAAAENLRVATYNASMNRNAPGALAEALAKGDDAQILKVAKIIEELHPDVLLINEFDFAQGQDRAFVSGYLNDAYPYSFIAPSNTGVSSGFDLNNDGKVGTESFDLANDSYGFGTFEGQYGMVVLSKFPIDGMATRTFQTFRWADMPNARQPMNPDGTAYYDADEWAALRLSSKSHWDVAINVDDEILHFLVSHPTPPVFDGPEDKNGTRNADEIRFWADYVAGADYMTDDQGRAGGLADGAHFVIAGDMNSDPFDGDSVSGAAQQLLDSPKVNGGVSPTSEGGAEAAASQAGANQDQMGDPALDTADFNDEAPGNLRVDYVLPSTTLTVHDAGVFWPKAGQAGAELVDASDHRPVWIDITLD